ncbi:MAG: class E sortase [Ilumatobacteraceae bacterium]
MRFRLIFVLLGLACVGAGVTLVVQGELENREQEEVFATAQTKLYSSFEVFSEPEAKKPVAEIVKTLTAEVKQNAIAILSIEEIGLKVATVTFRKYEDLRTAVGYIPNSDLPGEPGISFIVGHRTGFGSPFRELDQLVLGDRITLKSANGEINEYLVEFVEIKRPTQAIPELKKLNGETNLLLVTCHPEFSTEFRLIVGARGV